jgi:transposase
MTKKTTRNEQYTGSVSTLYMAMELSSKEWNLGFSIGMGQKARRRHVEANDEAKLLQEIEQAKKRFQLPRTARVLSCYEAGRDGFWFHHRLTEAGIENLVVDSSSIEVNRRARRAKADGLDVESLLKQLIRYDYGEKKVWSVVRVPTPEQEDRRQPDRELRTLKKERTRTLNRIKGLLASQGVRLQMPLNLTEEKVEGIRLSNGSGLQPRLKSRLKREWQHVVFLREQIDAIQREQKEALRRREEPEVVKIRQLGLLRGVGPVSSSILVEEFFGWRDFKNGRQVGSLAGLTPTPYDSGTMRREQGISKAGNRHVRGIAIELAWSWLRHQEKSELTRWFLERFGGAGKRARKVGIVALARRLLIALWRFLETGALPEGAELKATS